MTGPALSENTAQLLPNWYDMTMPDTTPMAKTTAKIFSQYLKRSRYSALPVFSHNASSTARKLARPIENAGKMK